MFGAGIFFSGAGRLSVTVSPLKRYTLQPLPDSSLKSVCRPVFSLSQYTSSRPLGWMFLEGSW